MAYFLFVSVILFTRKMGEGAPLWVRVLRLHSRPSVIENRIEARRFAEGKLGPWANATVHRKAVEKEVANAQEMTSPANYGLIAHFPLHCRRLAHLC
jgi:hypothetical protein